MKKSQKKAIRALVEAQSRGQKELIYNSGTENELKITVVSAIPHTKRTAMIMEIVSLNFANEIVDVDSYMPTALELSRRYAVLKYYTDLKFPSDIDELWLILNHTSIYDDVVEFVGVDIAKIFDEADKMISAKLPVVDRLFLLRTPPQRLIVGRVFFATSKATFAPQVTTLIYISGIIRANSIIVVPQSM